MSLPPKKESSQTRRTRTRAQIKIQIQFYKLHCFASSFGQTLWQRIHTQTNTRNRLNTELFMKFTLYEQSGERVSAVVRLKTCQIFFSFVLFFFTGFLWFFFFLRFSFCLFLVFLHFLTNFIYLVVL